MATADVCVLGGGIWGLSTAYHLTRRCVGRVAILERASQLAAETTSQSAGQVGQLRGDPILARAVGYTLETVSGFAEATGHDAQFVRCGSVHVALSDARARQFERLEAAAGSIGYPVQRMEPNEIPRLAPALESSSIVAALHVPNDGYVDARQCALAYGAAAIDAGAQVVLDCEVQSLSRVDGVYRLTTSQGEWHAPRVVIAGGPWTQKLMRQLDFVAPMYPIRLQQARTVNDNVSAHHPVVRVPDESCYIRPEKNAYLFGYFDPDPLPIDLTQKLHDFRTRHVLPEPALIQTAIDRLQKVMPRLSELSIDEYRQGMMTCTPDGKFVLGPVPGKDGICVATGCGGTGIAASAAVGKWLSEWAIDGRTGEDLSQYDPGRFGDRPADDAWLRESARATSAAYYRLP